MPDTSFTQVWNKIGAHAGQVFSTVTGKQFVYNFDGNVVRPEHTKRNIPRSDFEKAHALMPLKGPGQINSIRARAGLRVRHTHRSANFAVSQ